MITEFYINQIVQGVKAGFFVILGFRQIEGEWNAQVKSVNPANFTEYAPGEFALPLTAIKRIGQ